MPQNRRSIEIRRLLDRRVRDALTYAQLARVSGLRPTTLSWWAWRLRREEHALDRGRERGPVSFVEVVIPAGEEDLRVEIVFRSGRWLLVPPVIAAKIPSRSVEVLEGC